MCIRDSIQTEFAAEQMPRFLEEATQWVADGSLKYREDITDGLDNVPEAFRGLLSGRNFGKALVRVAE